MTKSVVKTGTAFEAVKTTKFEGTWLITSPWPITEFPYVRKIFLMAGQPTPSNVPPHK